MAEFLLFPSGSSESSAPPQPPDADARRCALDIHSSFLVEAPAGSGKTGLLIQRFLKLLADDSVTAPEQVLAITFTLKATAEMRARVLAHLHAARDAVPASTDFDRQTRALALAVLARDEQLGWQLLDHPHRLHIRTIDSVCMEIARTLPVLSGSGGRLTPADNADPLYQEAARRTLLLLGGDDRDLNRALHNLLLHRDGNLADCQSLIAHMLSLRDQWGDLIPLLGPELDDASLEANVLPRLQLALDHIICSALTQLAELFPPDALADLAHLAGNLARSPGYNGQQNLIAPCVGIHDAPQPISDHLPRWLALLHLLLTKEGSWRSERGITGRNLKFEYDRKHPHHARLTSILDRLRDNDELLRALAALSSLPPARYPDDQWAVAKSLFRVLGRALVELQLVFAAHNQCDFTEFSLLARHALRQDSGADDLASALGARLQHLLVDEMQDTSIGQYELIQELTESWDGHSQTVFLVGDPRQSIYLFRQARVERFLHAARTQRLGSLPLTHLRLSANFRSQHILVQQFNQDFSLIFPTSLSPHAQPYAPVESVRPESSYSRGIVWHAHPQPASPTRSPSLIPDIDSEADSPSTSTNPAVMSRALHAQQILRIAREWFAKPLPKDRRTVRDHAGKEVPAPWRIAVLVSSRNHLAEIVAAFDNDPLGKLPYRAVDITPLAERQEVLDLTALTRALLHPTDRVAALAVLRAPWCGLSLADLHTLTGADDPAFKRHSILRLIEERSHLLLPDSLPRLQRVQQVLSAAAAQRARVTTAQLVERAWRSLGGDAWLTLSQLTNARRFFQLLDQLESPGIGIDSTLLADHLQKLYAEPEPIPMDTPHVELLTIHAAKGLEWDVVFVPALERGPGRSNPRLLAWSVLDPQAVANTSGPHQPDAAPILLAPIAGRGEESKALNNWLNRIERTREAAERKRLFYVVSTRAREELHLFAAPSTNANGEINPHSASLLASAWPAAEQHFAQPAAGRDSTTDVGAPGLASETWVPAANLPPAVSTPPLEFASLDLAAAAAPSHPVLQRLPDSFDPSARFTTAQRSQLPYGDPDPAAVSTQTSFIRPEGSFAARSFGNAVHACLELLANRMRSGDSPAALLAELPAWAPRIAALLRADGLPRTTVDDLTRKALAALTRVLTDPDGLWLLAPHPASASELAITAWPASSAATSDTTLRPTSVRPTSVRVDRIFHAGPEPHHPGQDFLWIVDYKTASHSLTGLDSFLVAQRAEYGPQLENYASILAQAQSKSLQQVRLALYFPAIPHIIWWKPEPARS